MTSVMRALLLAALMTAAVPLRADAADIRCSSSRTYVHAFTVKTNWEKKIYAPGDVASLTVTVSRPAPEDPLGLGIPTDPPMKQPAEDVDVSTSFQGFFPYVFDRDFTNANGKAKLTLKIPRDAKKGPVDAYTYASILHNGDGPACTDFEEYGYKWDIPAIVIR